MLHGALHERTACACPSVAILPYCLRVCSRRVPARLTVVLLTFRSALMRETARAGGRRLRPSVCTLMTSANDLSLCAVEVLREPRYTAAQDSRQPAWAAWRRRRRPSRRPATSRRRWGSCRWQSFQQSLCCVTSTDARNTIYQLQPPNGHYHAVRFHLVWLAKLQQLTCQPNELISLRKAKRGNALLKHTQADFLWWSHSRWRAQPAARAAKAAAAAEAAAGWAGSLVAAAAVATSRLRRCAAGLNALICWEGFFLKQMPVYGLDLSNVVAAQASVLLCVEEPALYGATRPQGSWPGLEHVCARTRQRVICAVCSRAPS